MYDVPCPHYLDNQGFCHRCGVCLEPAWHDCRCKEKPTVNKGYPRRFTLLDSLLAVAGAVERRKSTPWTQGEIAAECDLTQRSVQRYLADFRKHCGLVTEEVMAEDGAGLVRRRLRTVGKWSIVDYVRRAVATH